MIDANQSKYQSVLFDLDGTLADTALDILTILNQSLAQINLPTVDGVDKILPHISDGLTAILNAVCVPYCYNDNWVNNFKQQFFATYQQNICQQTTLFPGIKQLLTYLDENHISWGIVTNKLTVHTNQLVDKLDIHPHCIICGDTTPYSKPHPLPLLTALKLLQVNKQQCVFVGDAHIDVQAGNRAGVCTIIANYGYGSKKENPRKWQADGYIDQPAEIINWLSFQN